MLDLIRLSPRLLFPPGGVDLYRQIALLSEMSEGDEVLDVASGKGIPIEYFVREHGVHGSGVEADARLVAEAEERSRKEGLASKLQFQSGRYDSLPYRDEIFDVVVGELGIAAHADPADVVRELVRVTKPGGVVVLVQLVWKAPVDEARQRVLSAHLGARPQMLVQWKRLLRDCGVEALHTEDWSDEETSFRPRAVKPFPDFAEIFSLPEKIGILRRAWARWGIGGVSAVMAREREVHRLLTRERILGLDLIKGRKRAEVAPARGDGGRRSRDVGGGRAPTDPGRRTSSRRGRGAVPTERRTGRPRGSRSSDPKKPNDHPRTERRRPMTQSLLCTESGIHQVQEALREQDLDGWLLYEFRGANPIAKAMLDVGKTTRRGFFLIPREGEPQALIHAIEGSSWRHWPWNKRMYSGWREMEEALGELLEGRGRLAMEVSPGAAVPTLDYLPAGMAEVILRSGVEAASSGDLVSRFYSVWTKEQLDDHLEAAEILVDVARRAFERAAEAIREGSPTNEGALSEWIRVRADREGSELAAGLHRGGRAHGVGSALRASRSRRDDRAGGAAAHRPVGGQARVGAGRPDVDGEDGRRHRRADAGDLGGRARRARRGRGVPARALRGAARRCAASRWTTCRVR